MTKEQIEEIAIKEWENLYDGAFPYTPGVEWEFWLKGIESVLGKYGYTQGDMMAAFDEGARQHYNSPLDIDSFIENNDSAFIDWLYETKQQGRT